SVRIGQGAVPVAVRVGPVRPDDAGGGLAGPGAPVSGYRVRRGGRLRPHPAGGAGRGPHRPAARVPRTGRRLKQAAVEIGVDPLDPRPLAGAGRRNGAVYTRHVAAADEHDLSTGDDIAIAAAVAVKESLVKAVGGRPSGFSWHDFVHRDGEPPDAVARLLADAVPGIATASGVGLTERRTYAVPGASRAAVPH